MAENYPHTASLNVSNGNNTTSINVLNQSKHKSDPHNQTDSFDKRRISTLYDKPKKPVYEVAAKAFRNSPARYANYFEPIQRSIEGPLRTERNVHFRPLWES